MAIELRDPSSAIENAGRLNKMRAYLNATARPLAREFQDPSSPFYHPEARVLVGGSAAKNVIDNNPLRVGSDFDLLVFDPRLRDMETYLQFLDQLRAYNHWFVQGTGTVPVVFTSATEEEHFRGQGKESMRYNRGMGMYTDLGLRSARSPHVELNGTLGDHFLPLHLLVYPDIPTYSAREHPDLARRLLASTICADESQAKPELIRYNWPNPTIAGLDTARWRLEKALAELILNQDVLPQDNLELLFKNMILTVLRTSVLHSVYPQADGAGIEDILDNLDRDYAHLTGGQLADAFCPLLQIHRHDHRRSNEEGIEELVRPALLMADMVDALREQCEEYGPPTVPITTNDDYTI